MTLPFRMGRMPGLLFLGVAVVPLAGCGGASREPSGGRSNPDGTGVHEGSAPHGSGAWRSVPLKEKAAGEFASVACPAAGDCWATANLGRGGGQIFHFDGQEWQRTPIPTEMHYDGKELSRQLPGLQPGAHQPADKLQRAGGTMHEPDAARRSGRSDRHLVCRGGTLVSPRRRLGLAGQSRTRTAGARTIPMNWYKEAI